MRVKWLLFFLNFALVAGCSKKVDLSEQGPPNIIVILVDDAGYADFGFMGSEDLRTPHLDRLAHAGMIFTDAHVSASVCAPSRAGLLTGLYQQRFGFECNALLGFEGIDTSVLTIAEAMRSGGYRTGAFGKWHVGDPVYARPHNRGFDYSWTFLSGVRSYFPNDIEDVPEHLKSIRENDVFTTFEGYLTDVLSDRAIDFIEKNKNEPFFMYWSPNAVHTPMEATESDLEIFKNHPRQELAAMTWALDRAVGNIVLKLESEKLLDNTLIFFLSDNGGAANNQSSNLPLKGFKGNKYEGGHRIPFFVHWPRAIESGSVFNGLTSALDIFPTCLEVSGINLENDYELDGESLLPFFTENEMESPHQSLFWRKEGMAAARIGDYKMIMVDSLGHRLYNLNEDISEKDDLSTLQPELLEKIQTDFDTWEDRMIDPLWVESNEWNEVTWWIHKDLFDNHKVRVESPADLEELGLK